MRALGVHMVTLPNNKPVYSKESQGISPLHLQVNGEGNSSRSISNNNSNNVYISKSQQLPLVEQKVPVFIQHPQQYIQKTQHNYPIKQVIGYQQNSSQLPQNNPIFQYPQQKQTKLETNKSQNQENLSLSLIQSRHNKSNSIDSQQQLWNKNEDELKSTSQYPKTQYFQQQHYHFKNIAAPRTSITFNSFNNSHSNNKDNASCSISPREIIINYSNPAAQVITKQYQDNYLQSSSLKQQQQLQILNKQFPQQFSQSKEQYHRQISPDFIIQQQLLQQQQQKQIQQTYLQEEQQGQYKRNVFQPSDQNKNTPLQSLNNISNNNNNNKASLLIGDQKPQFYQFQQPRQQQDDQRKNNQSQESHSQNQRDGYQQGSSHNLQCTLQSNKRNILTFPISNNHNTLKLQQQQTISSAIPTSSRTKARDTNSPVRDLNSFIRNNYSPIQQLTGMNTQLVSQQQKMSQMQQKSPQTSQNNLFAPPHTQNDTNYQKNSLEFEEQQKKIFTPVKVNPNFSHLHTQTPTTTIFKACSLSDKSQVLNPSFVSIQQSNNSLGPQTIPFINSLTQQEYLKLKNNNSSIIIPKLRLSSHQRYATPPKFTSNSNRESHQQTPLTRESTSVSKINKINQNALSERSSRNQFFTPLQNNCNTERVDISQKPKYRVNSDVVQSCLVERDVAPTKEFSQNNNSSSNNANSNNNNANNNILKSPSIQVQLNTFLKLLHQNSISNLNNNEDSHNNTTASCSAKQSTTIQQQQQSQKPQNNKNDVVHQDYRNNLDNKNKEKEGNDDKYQELLECEGIQEVNQEISTYKRLQHIQTQIDNLKGTLLQKSNKLSTRLNQSLHFNLGNDQANQTVKKTQTHSKLKQQQQNRSSVVQKGNTHKNSNSSFLEDNFSESETESQQTRVSNLEMQVACQDILCRDSLKKTQELRKSLCRMRIDTLQLPDKSVNFQSKKDDTFSEWDMSVSSQSLDEIRQRDQDAISISSINTKLLDLKNIYSKIKAIFKSKSSQQQLFQSQQYPLVQFLLKDMKAKFNYIELQLGEINFLNENRNNEKDGMGERQLDKIQRTFARIENSIIKIQQTQILMNSK